MPGLGPHTCFLSDLCNHEGRAKCVRVSVTDTLLYIYKCVYMYVCTYACVCVCMYVCTYVYMHIRISVYMYIYIHTYMCIYIYLHMCNVLTTFSSFNLFQCQSATNSLASKRKVWAARIALQTRLFALGIFFCDRRQGMHADVKRSCRVWRP